MQLLGPATTGVGPAGGDARREEGREGGAEAHVGTKRRAADDAEEVKGGRESERGGVAEMLGTSLLKGARFF